MANKPRVVKDYEKLDPEIQEQIKLMYPYGFAKHLIQYKNAEGKFVSALPFETDDRYYLVRMTLNEARQIIETAKVVDIECLDHVILGRGGEKPFVSLRESGLCNFSK